MSSDPNSDKTNIGVTKPILLYVGTAFAILQGADLLVDRLALPGWLFTSCLVAAVLGLPLVAATAYVQSRHISIRRTMRVGRMLTWRNAFTTGMIVFAGLGIVSATQKAMVAMRGDDAAWATGALLDLARLTDVQQWDSAWALGERMRKQIPDDSAFNELGRRYSAKISLAAIPAGLSVTHDFCGSRDSTTSRLVGTTPLDTVIVPRGPLCWRVARGKQVVAEVMSETENLQVMGFPPVDTAAPAGMVRARGGNVLLTSPGLQYLPSLKLSDFYLGRFEVTNREYQRFVDAGGYEKEMWWKHPLVVEGKTLRFDEAMQLFVDRTGRRGPSTWEAGHFPDGKEAHPVAGISWYEAAAYAAFAGQSLPTIYHWIRGAGIPYASLIVPRSNFSIKGTLPVGAAATISTYGSYDMAGNVREWCANTTHGQRYILGASHVDDPYEFTEAIAQPPWDRSPTNGMRLAQYTDTLNLALASREILRTSRDLSKERPVSDAEFEIFQRLYNYDRRALGAVLEDVDSTSSEYWIRQRVSFDAGYGRERLIEHVFLPRNAKPPYQAVVFFPGSYVIHQRSSTDLTTLWGFFIDYITKSGRAFIFPVYRGTFERPSGLKSPYPEKTAFFREHMISWVTEIRRTADYVEARPDLDENNFAYFGYSWGGSWGGIIPALEPRIKTVMLYVAGLHLREMYPEVDPFNYLPRIKQPTLLMNGRYDFFFPYETSQKPMFALLGTPREHKKFLLYEGAHDVPKPELIKETLAWMDKYLAPVRR